MTVPDVNDGVAGFGNDARFLIFLPFFMMVIISFLFSMKQLELFFINKKVVVTDKEIASIPAKRNYFDYIWYTISIIFLIAFGTIIADLYFF
mgnify:CR=1 FL=1